MDDNQSLTIWLEKHQDVNLTIRYERVLLYGGHTYRLEMINNNRRVVRYIDLMDLMDLTTDTVLDDMYRELTKE